MTFNSIVFLFSFLPICLILCYVVPKRFRNVPMLLCSLVFYAWGNPTYLLLMAFSVVFNYLTGLQLAAYQEEERHTGAKVSMICAVVVNLLVLGFFKYYGFLLSTINSLTGLHLSAPELPLPLGISFFTFSVLSYVLDVYRGKAEVQKNFLDFALFVTFFPKVISGPIVQYHDMAAQLKERSMSPAKFGAGISLFLVGLAKKVLLADNLGVTFSAISGLDAMSAGTAWLGMILYSLQLYFDFSGYSDMAIGLAQLFGFTWEKNFDYPYLSTGISEFWRRWHISLGSWFRDYLYIPLGGSRVKSRGRLIFNLFVVWFSTGLWHGANWTFIAWGLMYFVLLCVEKLTGFEKCSVPLWLAWIYTMLFVVLGWVLFRAENLTGAVKYVLAMFGIGASGLLDTKAAYYMAEYKLFFLLAIAASLPIAGWLGKAKEHLDGAISVLYPVWIIGVYAVAVSFIVKGGYNPFIYFNF